MSFTFKVIVYGTIGAMVVGGMAMIYTGDIIGNTTLARDGWTILIIGVVSFFGRLGIKIFTGV